MSQIEKVETLKKNALLRSFYGFTGLFSLIIGPFLDVKYYYLEITIDSITETKCMFILIAIFLLIFNTETPTVPSTNDLFNSLPINWTKA